MCGIVGARHDWLLGQGFQPESTIQRAIAALRWRGPDGEGVVRAGPWWLGCARLAIAGPNSRQPVRRRGGRHVGVLNGAVTNARELFEELAPGAGQRQHPPNDAWLPLLAVEAERPDLLRSLEGHHAYAVADAQTGELVLGQDSFAEKPLFCLTARLDGRWQLVAFASTPAALHRLGMPVARSRRRTAEWFRFGWCEASPQRLPGMLRLEALPQRGMPFVACPGHAAWVAPLVCNAPSSPRSTPRPEALRGRVVDAVRRCLDTSVPAALSLSGGLDSSCLAFAAALSDEHPPAYQFRADGAPDAERRAAAAVASAAGLELRPVGGGPELLDALPDLIALAGQPLGDPSILAVHAVARAAARDGAKVLLGGEGADELLWGYRRYRTLAHLPRLPALRCTAPRWSMRYAARWWRAVVAANPVRALLAVTPPGFASEVLAPEFAARACWRDAEPLTGDADLPAAARAGDLCGYLPRDLLVKIDVATMAAGVEGRSPYLHAGLEAFAEPRAFGKRALRDAFADLLPTCVRRAPKRGFAVPLDRWFRAANPWLDVLAESRSRSRTHLQSAGIARAVDLHRRGTADIGHALYLLLAFELYLRAVEAAPEAPPS